MSDPLKPQTPPLKSTPPTTPAPDDGIIFRPPSPSDMVPEAPAKKLAAAKGHKAASAKPATPLDTLETTAPADDPLTADAPVNRFEIEWDEERPPESGKIFTEAPPEPPPQPFEIVHEPKVKTPQGAPRPMAATLAVTPPPQPRRSVRSERPPLWIRAFWGFMPLLLLLLGYGSVILTQRGVGYAWDEAYYYQPSIKAADWLLETLRGHHPFDRASIDKYWEERHEHPSVQKFLSGLSIKAFPDPARHQYAMRLPIAILFGLSLSLIYLLGRRAWGPVPGLLAALLYATLPRLFGQAHFASMETPLDFMMLLTVFCFLRGLESPRWAILTGVSFGLLLATKLNGFFLPVPLILWGQLFARRRYGNNLFAMLTLGPLVFVVAWPWLWHDTAMRILEYLAFHARHQLTAVYYLGRTWGYDGPNAPWHYPLVLIVATVPLTRLALMGWGLVRTLAALPRRPIGALYLLCVFVMLGVASGPSTPKYDGVRLFTPIFPFLALLGGSGAVGILSYIQQRIIERRYAGDSVRQRRALRWAATGLTLLVLLDGAVAIGLSHPYLLSYFNPLVGGLRGAHRMGFETTYWGEALNDEVITKINNLPNGSRLMPLALHELCLQQLQQWGVIKQEIKIGGEPPYDYHLLLMRQGFFRRPERALAEPNQFIKHIWYKSGVPMIGLFQTGQAFEYYWPNRPPTEP